MLLACILCGSLWKFETTEISIETYVYYAMRV